MTNKELKEKVLESVSDNHMWINRSELINPTDELLKQIGSWVIDNLKTKESLLPMLFNSDNNAITEIQKLTPVFYCSINAS